MPKHQDGQHHSLGDEGGDDGGQAGQAHQGVEHHNAQMVARAGAHLLPAGIAPVQAHSQGVAEQGAHHAGDTSQHQGLGGGEEGVAALLGLLNGLDAGDD